MPVLEKDPLEGSVDAVVVMFEVALAVTLAETDIKEEVLAADDAVVGSDTMLLVPLPVKVLLELLNETVLEVPVVVRLMVEVNDGVVVVRLVPLLLAMVEVELKPLEVPVLTELVSSEEVLDKLEVVVAKVGSVAIDTLIDPDEDEEEPVDDEVLVDDVELDEVLVEELELDEVLLEELECDEVLLEEFECDEVLDEKDERDELLVEEVEKVLVDEVLVDFLLVEDELVATDLPLTQSQRLKSCGAVYFWNGDEVLVLEFGVSTDRTTSGLLLTSWCRSSRNYMAPRTRAQALVCTAQQRIQIHLSQGHPCWWEHFQV